MAICSKLIGIPLTKCDGFKYWPVLPLSLVRSIDVTAVAVLMLYDVFRPRSIQYISPHPYLRRLPSKQRRAGYAWNSPKHGKLDSPVQSTAFLYFLFLLSPRPSSHHQSKQLQ